MKKALFIVLLALVSCRADDYDVLPIGQVSDRVTFSDPKAGFILQNFFGENPDIAILIKMGKKGYVFEAKEPTPAKPYEVTCEYKWSYKKVGDDYYSECYERSFSATVKKGSYVTLRVQAFVVGTSWKSDYIFTQVKM